MIPSKENETMFLLVNIIEKTIQRDDGTKIYLTKWIRASKDINLGSIKEPNKDILEIKYVPEYELGKYFS